jgi:hypothetical protein
MKSILILGLLASAAAFSIDPRFIEGLEDDVIFYAETASEDESEPALAPAQAEEEEDSQKLKNLPRPRSIFASSDDEDESSIDIRLRQTPPKTWQANQKVLSNMHTGLSPAEGELTWDSLEAPLAALLHIEVSRKTKTTKRPLNVLGPLDAPAAKKSKTETTEQAKIISWDDDTFDNDLWAFNDPMLPSTSVFADANDSEWDKVIDQIIADMQPLEGRSHEEFIFAGILSIHKNLDLLKPFMIYDHNRKFVCRHFATISLLVFTKLFSREEIVPTGIIRQISAGRLDHNWQRVGEGHVWNIVTIFEGDNEYYFFVDVQGKIVIDLIKFMESEKDVVTSLGILDDVWVQYLWASDSSVYEWAMFSLCRLELIENNTIANASPATQGLAAARSMMVENIPPANTTVKKPSEQDVKRRLFFDELTH